MKQSPIPYVLVALLLLAGLFVLLRPADEPAEPAAPRSVAESAPGTEPAPQPAASEPAAPAQAATRPPNKPQALSFELQVRGKRLISGPEVLRVRQGDAVQIRITADLKDELHLHGYDLSVQLEAGRPASLLFIADRSGRFEYELERLKLELGALEVEPR